MPENYLIEQSKAIIAWKKEEPSVVTSALGTLLSPISSLLSKTIPPVIIQSALEAANAAGKFLADSDDILRDAKVSCVADLQTHNLALSDKLANNIHNWAIGLAASEGAAAGAVGIMGMAADIPALMTLSLRTIHKIGLCYGYEATCPEENQFVLGIMSAVGANSTREKHEALLFLRGIEKTIMETAWRQAGKQIAKDTIVAETALLTLRTLAKQLGVNLTKRKALQAIPAIGAIVGGSANGWYVKELGWAARRSYQERWLKDNSLWLEKG